MNILQAFENWMKEHGRTYSSSEEKAKRFAIFKEEFDHIENFNSQGKHRFTLGLNAFSDLTDKEFDETYGCTTAIPNTNPSSVSSFSYQDFEIEDLPQNWDWRTQGAVTSVKDQGKCGCSWAFAIAAAVEGLTPFYNKPYGKLVNLSVQELVACSKPYGTNGCKGGQAINAIKYVRDHGLVTEEKFPYRFADDQSCDTAFESSPDIKISGYEAVPEFDEVALAKAVYHQPVVVAHSASINFRRYKGGIFLDADGKCARGNISHTSTLVGFGTTPLGEEYWILKNSWSSSWGVHGYMKINRNSKNKRGVCNLAKLPVFAIL
ncbi:senescence-specific cysteine protease SAG39 [Rosa chinensis]|nr:senescence-specific cysteine protease SAG39 [Rosa chinensis]